MSEQVVRQPALVAAPHDAGGFPKIRARRCECGHVFHPPHPYGCERCGRDGSSTSPVEIDACGVLTAVATVHQHPKLKTPFALGRVTLDGGPPIEARLDERAADAVPGARVRGVLVPEGTTDSGAQSLELRFVLDGGR